ncbi:MAG: RsmB/NOP family class I SAM-dependent RNA methyltransferase [Pseudomonadota bacterium]
MTPKGRAQAAIEILQLWSLDRHPIERVLTRWGRSNRYAGSGDRHAIADIVYAVLRRARSLQILGGAGDPGGDLAAFEPRVAVLAHLAMQGEDAASIADGSRHAPGALSRAEAAALAGLPADADGRLADEGRAARFDLPDHLAAPPHAVPEPVAAALTTRAPTYLRVNTLKADTPLAIDVLGDDGIAAEPGPLSPTALVVTTGARRIAQSAAFRNGLVELQDAASQASVDLAGPAPGMTVLDLCAGAGGKTLALGAQMHGKGRLIAHDIDPRRMAELPLRADRAGLTVERLATPDLPALQGRVDLVFVDAPCSGSGSWRRDPVGKWHLGPKRLAELCRVQDDVLDQALRLVAPSGRVVFATCSFLAAEGPLRLEALADRSPRLIDAVTSAARFSNMPAKDGADGFFAARMDMFG